MAALPSSPHWLLTKGWSKLSFLPTTTEEMWAVLFHHVVGQADGEDVLNEYCLARVHFSTRGHMSASHILPTEALLAAAEAQIELLKKLGTANGTQPMSYVKLTQLPEAVGVGGKLIELALKERQPHFINCDNNRWLRVAQHPHEFGIQIAADDTISQNILWMCIVHIAPGARSLHADFERELFFQMKPFFDSALPTRAEIYAQANLNPSSS